MLKREDVGVADESVTVLGSRVRVDRVRGGSDVDDANLAVDGRAVDEAEAGGGVTRARMQVVPHERRDHRLVVADDEALRESCAGDECGDVAQCEEVARAEHERVELRLERVESGALLHARPRLDAGAGAEDAAVGPRLAEPAAVWCASRPWGTPT